MLRGSSRLGRPVASFLVPPLAACTLLYQVLTNLRIPLISSETLLVGGAVLSVAAALGALAAVGGARVRVTVMALTALLFLDLALHLPQRLESSQSGTAVAGDAGHTTR